jgi:hypothetical protein
MQVGNAAVITKLQAASMPTCRGRSSILSSPPGATRGARVELPPQSRALVDSASLAAGIADATPPPACALAIFTSQVMERREIEDEKD